MTYQTSTDALSALSEVLDKEIALLSAGRLDDALALTDTKAEALQCLENALEDLAMSDQYSGALQRDVQAVARLAEEAAVHFRAVQNGLSKTIDRLERVAGAKGSDFYSKTGDKIEFSENAGNILKSV